MRAVVLEHVLHVLGVDEWIVDADNFDVRVLQRRAKNKAADATEAINSDADGHGDCWRSERKDADDWSKVWARAKGGKVTAHVPSSYGSLSLPVGMNPIGKIVKILRFG